MFLDHLIEVGRGRDGLIDLATQEIHVDLLLADDCLRVEVLKLDYKWLGDLGDIETENFIPKRLAALDRAREVSLFVDLATDHVVCLARQLTALR